MDKKPIVFILAIIGLAFLVSKAMGAGGAAVPKRGRINEAADGSSYTRMEQDKKLYVVGRWSGNYSLYDRVYVGGEITGLSEGKAAIVKADVGVCSTKTGDIDHLEITNLKSVQPMKLGEMVDMLDVADMLDVPDAATDTVDYSNDQFFKYTVGNETYYIFNTNGPYEVIWRDTEYIRYAAEEPLEPLHAAISIGYRGGSLTPELTEEQILNMSETELWFLRELYANDLLEDILPIYYYEGVYPLEEGYKYRGMAASRPATNVEEACLIAEQEWPCIDDETYEYCAIGEPIEETDEYWFFRRRVERSEESDVHWVWHSEYFVVYKKDYYDSRENWPDFVLTEDYVRNLMLRCYTDNLTGEITVCIGEYLNEVDDGIVFRRYFLKEIGYHGIGLEMEEWYFTQDGAVKYIDTPECFMEEPDKQPFNMTSFGKEPYRSRWDPI